MNKRQAIISIILVVSGLYFIIRGHAVIGFTGLLTMFFGLGLLLTSLFIYNQTHK